MITQQELKEMIIYNPDDGTFRKMFKFDQIDIAEMSGSKRVYIRINGKKYSMRKLIWLYMTGEYPDHPLYHVNGNGLDLRWCNITRHQNKSYRKPMSTGKRNTSGCVGVSFSERDGKWIAVITRNGKREYLGAFDEKDDAVAARQIAEIM